MIIRLYVDEDALDKDLIRALRARGRDYLTQGKSHAGIVLAQQQGYSVGEQMRRLLKLIAVKSAEEMRNQIEFLSAWV